MRQRALVLGLLLLWAIATAPATAGERQDRRQRAETPPMLLFETLPREFADAGRLRPRQAVTRNSANCLHQSNLTRRASWPRGMITDVHVLSERWAVIEAIWNDYGSGSFGDHNLWLYDLNRHELVTGVHQGDTHTLNAEMYWFPVSRLLFLRGSHASQGWGGMQVIFNEHDEVKSALSLWQALFRVRPDLCRQRRADFFLARCDFEPQGLAIIFPDMRETGGEAEERVLVAWKSLFGNDFSFVTEAPVRRFPLCVTSADRQWELRDSLAGGGFQPHWKLFNRAGHEQAMGSEGFQQCGFFAGGFWRLENQRVFLAPHPMFPREHWQSIPWSDVQHVAVRGGETLMVTRLQQTLEIDRKGTVQKIYLTGAPSRWSKRQAYLTGAWSTGATVLAAEVVETFADGEMSRLWLIRR